VTFETDPALPVDVETASGADIEVDVTITAAGAS
jgi:hypothetical protein